MAQQFDQPTRPTQAELDDITESFMAAVDRNNVNIDECERALLRAHPVWCVADHSNADDPQSFHERPTLQTDDLQVSALIDNRHRGNGPEPLVNVWHEEENLTPAEARQLAEAILKAVQLLEG